MRTQLQRRKFPPPPGPRPPLTLAEVGLSAGPVPSTQETNLSSAPCVLGIPSPSLPSFSIPSLSPGIPQSRSQSQKAPAPHPSTAAAPLSSLDRHVGSPGEFPFPPPPSSLLLNPTPRGDAASGEGRAANQERAWRKGRGAGPPRPELLRLGVPSGFEMEGAQLRARLGLEGPCGYRRSRRQPGRGASGRRV